MRRLLLSALISAGLLAWVFRHTDAREIIEIARDIDPGLLAAGFILYLGGLFLRALRYRLLLNTPLGLWPLVLVTQVRNMFADLIPARVGTAAYVYLAVRRYGVELGDALNSFFSVFFLDLAALAPLVGIALVSLGGEGDLSAAGLMAAGLLFFTLSAAALLLGPRLLRPAAGILAGSGRRWPSRAAKTLLDLDLHYRRLRRRGALGPAFLLSLGIRLAKYGSWYFLLLAVIDGHPEAPAALPFNRALVGVIGAELSSTLPVGGLAGFGTYEAAWTLGFGAVGFSRSLAAASGLVTHIISQVIDYGLGIAALLWIYVPRQNLDKAPKTSV